jgi:hypothetical protein
MGKGYAKLKGRGAKAQPFIMLRKDIFQSPAWQALRPVSRDAFLFLRSRFNGVNNGNISCSYREIASYLHTSPATAGRAIDGLIDKGFIIVTKGAAFNMKQRQARKYALTHEPYDSNPRASNAWRSWTPMNGFADRPRKRDKKCGKNPNTVSPEIQNVIATDTDARPQIQSVNL